LDKNTNQILYMHADKFEHTLQRQRTKADEVGLIKVAIANDEKSTNRVR
jgi:hypothetical protein